MPRVLPLHTPCGSHGLGEELEPGVFICAIRRTWETSDSASVDTLGCGMLFPLCDHGQRGCRACHQNVPAPGPKDRVLALVFLAHRDGRLTHETYRVTRASLADLTPEALAGVADRVAREVPPASVIGRGAKEVVAAIAAMPRAA